MRAHWIDGVHETVPSRAHPLMVTGGAIGYALLTAGHPHEPVLAAFCMKRDPRANGLGRLVLAPGSLDCTNTFYE